MAAASRQAQVHIHAGAHRTGSSAFQMFLDINADAIRAQGFDLAYPDRDGARGGRLKLWFPAPRHDTDARVWREGKARGNLTRQMQGPARPLILSEENIIGRMTHFYGGAFYPTGAERMAHLARVLAPRRVGTLILLVRPYDSLFVSAYRKRAEDNVVRDFPEIADGMAGFQGGGWPELVASLQGALTPDRLLVLPYARPRRESDLAKLFLPDLDVAGLREPPAQVNASLSDAALQTLQARYRAGETAERAVVEAARAKYRDISAAAPFAAFTGPQKTRLHQRYAADLDLLRGMDGVRFVEALT